jgi:hypothetical protein
VQIPITSKCGTWNKSGYLKKCPTSKSYAVRSLFFFLIINYWQLEKRVSNVCFKNVYLKYVYDRQQQLPDFEDQPVQTSINVNMLFSSIIPNDISSFSRGEEGFYINWCIILGGRNVVECVFIDLTFRSPSVYGTNLKLIQYQIP